MRNFKKEEEKYENREKVLDAIKNSNKGITFKELKQNTGLSPGTLSDHLKALEKVRVITDKKDDEDKRKKIYMLTEEAIKDPSYQVDIIYKILRSKIMDCFDTQSIYEEVKDKNVQEITYRFLEENIIVDGIDMRKKEFDNHYTSLKNENRAELIISIENLYDAINFDPGFKKEEIEDMGKKELIDFDVKAGWLIGTPRMPGLFLKPKIISGWYYVLSEFLERCKNSDSKERREFYHILIKKYPEKYPPDIYKVGNLGDHEKQAISKLLDKILSMDPMDRYNNEYPKTLECHTIRHHFFYLV